MAYRKYPNSIFKKRMVLDAVYEKVNNTSQDSCAIKENTKLRLEQLYPELREKLSEQQLYLSRQAQATNDKNRQQEILKRIISHFIQVFNFCVDRGIYNEADRVYYGLDINQIELPNLSSEQNLITLSNHLITGEAIRLNNEGSIPMQNPKITDIEAELNKFLDLNNKQSTEKDAFDKERKDVNRMLPEIDSLIRDIYDEVEFYYRKQTPSNRRKLAREWGIIYVSDKNKTPKEVTVVDF